MNSDKPDKSTSFTGLKLTLRLTLETMSDWDDFGAPFDRASFDQVNVPINFAHFNPMRSTDL